MPTPLVHIIICRPGLGWRRALVAGLSQDAPAGRRLSPSSRPATRTSRCTCAGPSRPHLSLPGQDPRRGRAGAELPVSTLPAQTKDDPNFGPTESTTTPWRPSCPRGAGQPAGGPVTYQGCADGASATPRSRSGSTSPPWRALAHHRPRNRPRRRARRRDGPPPPPARTSSPAGPAALLVGNLVGVLTACRARPPPGVHTPASCRWCRSCRHDRPLGPGPHAGAGLALSGSYVLAMASAYPAWASRRRGSAATCRSRSRPRSPSA